MKLKNIEIVTAIGNHKNSWSYVIVCLDNGCNCSLKVATPNYLK